MEPERVQLAGLRDSVERLSALLRVLANRERLLLLARLAVAEFDVGQLGRDLAITQPTLSQQLGVLRRARLVATRRDGKHIYYRVASREALAVIAALSADAPQRPGGRANQA